MKANRIILYVISVLVLIYPIYKLGKTIGNELYQGNLIVIVILGLVLAYPANYLGKKVGKAIAVFIKSKNLKTK